MISPIEPGGIERVGLPRLVEIAKQLVAGVLSSGDLAIDATVGNGLDTLWLAGRVGPDGKVIGLDLQQEALLEASGRLREAGMLDRVALVRSGHEKIGRLVSEVTRRPNAIMFNLGYRPASDRSIATRAETTILALDASARLVAPGGIVTVVTYPGHPGGRLESDAVSRWSTGPVSSRAELLRVDLIHPATSAPWLLALSPRPDVGSEGGTGR